ncbi:MAG: EscU/YscU/HrcU family type III secretion system export apparatus switch protein [Polyangiales bacterium]
MAETKTEPGSPRRLARARAQGDAPFTYDWTLAAVLLGSVASSTYALPPFLEAWSSMARRLFAGESVFTPLLAGELLGPSGLLLLVPYLAVVAVLIAQRGVMWPIWRSGGSTESGAPLPRPSAWSRLGQRAAQWLKVSLLAGVLGVVLYDNHAGVLAAFQRDPAHLLPQLLRVSRALALRAAFVLIALGVLELVVQHVLRLRRLRMTRQEQLDEHRATVGDPLWLVYRQAQARQAAYGTLLSAADTQQLSAADVVLTGQGRALAVQLVAAGAAVSVRAHGAAAVELVGRAYSLGLPIESADTLVASLFGWPVEQPLSAALQAELTGLVGSAGPARQRAQPSGDGV